MSETPFPTPPTIIEESSMSAGDSKRTDRESAIIGCVSKESSTSSFRREKEQEAIVASVSR